MAAALELTPTLGAGAACRAMGLGRGEPARQKARVHRRTVMGPPRPRAPRPCPPLALDANERQTVLDTLNSERFADTAPAAVYATLLDEGIYLGSVRTMYRLLAANGASRERRNQLTHPTYTKPELLATAPNQVWSWDIERHEALSDRATVRDRRDPAVAAAGDKLRAARTGERQQGWQAALTKPGHGSIVRCRGSGEQTRKV